jgi:hypothetical protein
VRLGAGGVPKVELKPVPCEALWRSSGVVSLGGDAVDTAAVADLAKLAG